MPTSPPSSTPSADCRIDWRPSRLQVAALVLLAMLAGAAVMASALPAPSRPLLAGLATLHGLLLARRSAAAAPQVVACDPAGWTLRPRHDGRARRLLGVVVDTRWPLLRLRARDVAGRRVTLVWWPDTLAGDERRRLARIARAGTDTDNSLPSMAA